MFEALLRRRFDPALEAVMRSVSRRDIRGPLHDALAPARRSALQKAAERYAPEVAKLEAPVARRDPEAVRQYETIVEEAVASMRADRSATGVLRLFESFDARLYRDKPELMDDPNFPEAERTASLDRLDRFNRCTGLYETVALAIEPLLVAAERAHRKPVVHDIAAGHGGLALYLAERFGDRVFVEASDLRDEYLELGRTRAKERGLSVSFHVEDALDLSALGERGVDVVLCTQALHHFPPGMIARLLSEAARAAKVGVVFIDGERSWFTLGLMALTGALYGRTYTFFHDSTTSIRRMYYEEELALIARLSPCLPEASIETKAVPPSHVFVRVTRQPEASS